jgi:hypothetical protein
MPPRPDPQLEPGWRAGRLIDGYEFRVAGKPPAWTPPLWIRQLQDEGYDRAAEGDPYRRSELDDAGPDERNRRLEVGVVDCLGRGNEVLLGR